MKSIFETLHLESKRQFELINVTGLVKAIVSKSAISNGLVTLFSPHTTAGVRLNHDEPLLAQDIMKGVFRMAPLEDNYSHDLFEIRQEVSINERSNGHAHVKAFILGSSENLIIHNGALLLGDHQSIFFVEFDGGRKRQLHVKILGE